MSLYQINLFSFQYFPFSLSESLYFHPLGMAFIINLPGESPVESPVAALDPSLQLDLLILSLLLKNVEKYIILYVFIGEIFPV